jgi:hypothetical protein
MKSTKQIEKREFTLAYVSQHQITLSETKDDLA